MRALVRYFLVLTAVLAAIPATAGKIGFLEVERAVGSVQEGKAKLAELEAWATPRREQLVAQRQKVIDLQEQVTKQRGIASADVLKQLQQDLLQAQRDFEDENRSFKRDVEEKQNEFLSEVAMRMGAIASDYGRANGFDAIFTLKAQPLIFVADAADITDIVIRLYDKQFPVSAASN
ncbi:MAG: OmpH family outer membrane protein [Thermoanaerobaculales bacterium]